jgi:ABC-type Mn2+/Zn2+ transport system ATPase subunit
MNSNNTLSKPKIIMVCGCNGAVKSTFTKNLHNNMFLRYPIIGSIEIKKSL